MVDTTGTTRMLSVADLLTGSLRMVHASLSLRGAAEAMTEDGIGLLVVEDGRGGLAGVVSERDLVAAVADGTDLDAERLGNLMVDDVVTVDRDDSIGQAAASMVDADVRHLVVVDARHRPMGVVSARDVMRTFVAGDLATNGVVAP